MILSKEEAFNKYIKLLTDKKIPDAEIEQLVLQGWKECVDNYAMVLSRGNGKSTSQLIKYLFEES